MDHTGVVASVKSTIQQWIDAVQALDVDKTVSLYDEHDGTLLGTVDIDDNKVRHGRERIKEYFVHFLDKDAVKPCFPEMDAMDVQVLSSSPVVAMYNGYYSFHLTKNGTTNIVHAKYTYVLKETADSHWKILLHNSGMTPKATETL